MSEQKLTFGERRRQALFILTGDLGSDGRVCFGLARARLRMRLVGSLPWFVEVGEDLGVEFWVGLLFSRL